jgi:hypothetical protein
MAAPFTRIDLGRRTDFIAKRLVQFDPDQTWRKADAAVP